MGVTRISHASLLLTLVLATACSAPAFTARPDTPVPTTFSTSGTVAMPDRFWLAFEDPALDALVREALSENPGVRATWHRLAQAEASLKSKRSSLYPKVDGSAGGSVDARNNGDGVQTGSGMSLGLAASYEVDLWGKVSASNDIARLDAESSAHDVMSSAITLASQISATWYELVEQRAQFSILAEQVASAEKTLQMVVVSFDRGFVPRSDLLRQQQRVESIDGERDQATARIAVLEHQLAILLGHSPTDRVAPAVSELPPLPPMPATGIPLELIGRRPDVARAYLAVQSADNKVAVAITEQFPRISLSARLSTNPAALISDLVGSLAASIAAPIFDAGARKAEVERARAALLERIELYKQTVLAALAEIEDALVKEDAQQANLDSIERQLEMTEELLDQARVGYEAGMTDYLRVLDAEETHHSLQRRYLSARREMLSIRIGLYRALAGGWKMDDPTATK